MDWEQSLKSIFEMGYISIPDANAMEETGRRWAALLRPGLSIYFSGDLGAGKTTLIRGVLFGLGHQGLVTSPTYTLVEPYMDVGVPTYHFDLYRLRDPEELEMIGVRDMFASEALCLVEWPEKGRGVLPQADIEVQIHHLGKEEGNGRRLVVQSLNPLAPELEG